MIFVFREAEQRFLLLFLEKEGLSKPIICLVTGERGRSADKCQ
jgi:hypothetical protein